MSQTMKGGGTAGPLRNTGERRFSHTKKAVTEKYWVQGGGRKHLIGKTGGGRKRGLKHRQEAPGQVRADWVGRKNEREWCRKREETKGKGGSTEVLSDGGWTSQG